MSTTSYYVGSYGFKTCFKVLGDLHFFKHNSFSSSHNRIVIVRTYTNINFTRISLSQTSVVIYVRY